ncbi:MAG: PAS domain S-box protein [Pseudomonadota bacterium]
MKDQSKTKQVLIQELVSLRKRITELEQSESEGKPVEEETLHLSEGNYGTVFEDIRDVIFSADAKGKIAFISPAIEQLMGYQPGELEGKNFYQFIHTDDLSKIQRRFDELSRNILRSEEYRVITSAGTAHWVTSYSRPIFRDGIFQGVRGVITDIHDRKLAEQALRASEEQYRIHFENVSDVIFSFDREFRILSISPSLERVLGYKPEEFIGKSFADLNVVSPEYLEKIFSDTMRVFAGERLDLITYEFIARDGTRKYGEVSSAPLIRDGQVVAVVSVARDITVRKKVDEMLHITQFSIDCAAEAIVWIGRDGRYLYANDAYCHLLNYSREEILSLGIFDMDPDISAENWPEYWSKDKQEIVSFSESSRRTKDDILIPVEVNANYLAYGDKEFIVSFVRDIRERKRHEEQLKRQIDRLAALRAIDMAITGSLDIRVTFNIFLEHVVACLGVDAADVLVLDSHLYNKLTFVAGRGFRTDALRYTNLSLGAGYAGRVAQERKTIFIPDLEKEAQDLLKKSPVLRSENFVTYCGAPLIAKGQLKGVLEIFNRTPIEPSQEWLDFLEALATQAAIAIDNAKLFDDLQKSNLDLIQAYDNTLEGWSRALDLRDKETEGHSQRVMEMTLRLAGQMGMRDSELVHVRRGALLHDIGKMGIPDGILLKPGQLNDEEWEIMRKHPVYAYELLSPISHLRPALDIPYCHHEKWDGTGYPRGLKGEQIPLAARIFAIVDIWDALSSDRPYRPAWPEEKVREHIKEQTGKHFDPKVVEAFLELLNEFKPV